MSDTTDRSRIDALSASLRKQPVVPINAIEAADLLVELADADFENRCEITRLRAELAEARNKALEDAAACVERRVEDMKGLEKFNRSYALRGMALAIADIRKMKEADRNG